MLANSPAVTQVYPVSCSHQRLLKIDELLTKIDAVSANRELFQAPFASIEEMLSHVITRDHASDFNVLICGTFFIMKDVRRALGHPHGHLDECDDDLIN